MVLQAIPPIVAVAVIAFVITFSTNSNQRAARQACVAVHKSNVTLVTYLRPLLPDDQAFLDGLADNFEKTYQDCLAGV